MMVETISTPSSLTPALPTCPRDGAATRLSCGRCGTPICPSCLVRTAVGMRCPACSAAPAAPNHRRPRLVAALVTSLVGSLFVVAAVGVGGGTGEVDGEVAAMEAAAPGIGEVLTVGGFAVTLTRFECAADDAFLLSGMPTRRCEAVLRVRNDRFGSQDFTGSIQRVSDGFRRFGPSRLESVDMAPTPVGPGSAVDVDLVFRLPGTAEPSRLELRASTRQAPVAVSLRA